MYSLIELKTLVSSGRDPARSLPLRRGFLLIPLVVVCFAFLPKMQAGSLPPEISNPVDGCYPNFNKAEGCNALDGPNPFTGFANTAVGWEALNFSGSAILNTGLGGGAGAINTGNENTATGAGAMLLNLVGNNNTSNGTFALVFNSAASDNTAIGDRALENNDSSGAATANGNTAAGSGAMFENINAGDNTAVGADALRFNIDGTSLTAVGSGALNFNLIASGCTAVGDGALLFNDFFADGFPFGFFNDAVGQGALLSNTDGFSNNAFGEDALFFNAIAAANTAIGDAAALNNDSSALGSANFNTAVGFAALVNNVDGGQNTVVGAGAGPNLVAATDFS